MTGDKSENIKSRTPSENNNHEEKPADKVVINGNTQTEDTEKMSKEQDNNTDNTINKSDHKKTNDQMENMEQRSLNININSLLPEQLLTITVKVNGSSMNALLDSGATNSLIRLSNFEKANAFMTSHNPRTIVGLGNSMITTIGIVDLPIAFFGLNIITRFNIVQDSDIDYSLILGVDFLCENKIVINMNKRKISKHNKDKSFIDFYIDKDNTISNIVHEQIPVYCSNKVILKGNKTVKVPININLACSNIKNPDLNLLYYEGNNKNKHLESLNGIINRDSDNPFIFMKTTDETTHTNVVKKGDIVGTVSTILTVQNNNNDDDDNDDGQLGEKWTLEKMKKEIELGENLDDIQRQKVYEMLENTKGALSKGESDIGSANVTPHQIELTNNTPIWQKHRQFAEPVNQEIEKQCQELLSLDILEHSDSSWSSPVVPVRKADGQLRLCIDYRKVNSVTKTENFPMPNINNCIYKAHNVKYFSKLDLIRGYYQVPLDEQSRPYTAFSTTKNHFQFKRLSFGLKNSGIAFQKTMQQVLSPFTSSNIIIYIDDILIMTETYEEHLILVHKVLATLRNNGIKIKVKKCELFRNEVSFLGHLINENGIRKSPDFIEKVRDFPKPKTITQLRQFLGLTNFQRKFIKDCSTISKPLSEITGGPKRKTIKWTDEQTRAYNRLKEEIEKEVILSYPDYRPQANKLELFVDASGTGAGACLVQKQEGSYRVIAYASMSFSSTQTAYSTIERELTAIRWGIQVFRCFLYGVHFTLFTDHKPLIYLHNMSPYNSRLMRTLEELGEYDFDIKYRPGQDNQAADFLSRLNTTSNTIIEIPDNHKQLPKGLQLIRLIDGGGDSMFESLYSCIDDLGEDIENIDLPETHQELRKILVTELMDNLDKYKLKLNKQQRKQMKLMISPGQQPCSEILLAACQLFNLEIYVHHGMSSPIVFRNDNTTDKNQLIHLQCISMVHYNPVYERKRNEVLRNTINDKSINLCWKENETNEQIRDDTDEDNDSEIEMSDMIGKLYKCHLTCCHKPAAVSGSVVEYQGNKFCCLIDTGAQVSLMSEFVWNSLKNDNIKLEMWQCTNSLKGVGKSETDVIGCVNLKLKLLDKEMNEEIPFAVVRESAMPCCFLLGANFLAKNNITIDFGKHLVCMEHQGGSWKYPMNENTSDSVAHRLNVANFLGTVIMNENITDTDDDEEKEYNQDDVELVPKFIISTSDLKIMQNKNYALRQLKHKIFNQIPINQWKLNILNQFKRNYKNLHIIKGIMVKGDQDISPVVISFPFLVEVVNKVHEQLAHIGRHKLIDVIQQHFYHPALEKTARDICSTCSHCQLFKINNQPIAPPIIKIQTNHPFDLMALDLLQFPKSSKGNVAALVTIDHCSKWLAVTPLRDKRACTVANALQERILPYLPKIPDRILSDNGPEFIASDFEDILKDNNINHIYSTPYTPSSNGAVERVNRTITEMLKGLNSEQNQWDQHLAKLVITYNNTFHSQIGSSPSQYILTKSHNTRNHLPIDLETRETWKEGHPNFASFRINQKVIKKVQKMGNQLKYKLGQKFEGPFKVKKIQSNGVSYEIVKEGDPSENVIRAHHKQLRAWNEIPRYISKLLNNNEVLEHASTSQDYSHENDTDNETRVCIYSDSLISDTTDSSSSDSETDSRSDSSGSSSSVERSVTPATSCNTNSDSNDASITSESTDAHETIQREQNLTYSYEQFKGAPRQSTPIKNKDNYSSHENEISPRDFQKYLEQNEADLNLFNYLEQTFNIHDELLDRAQFLLSNITASHTDNNQNGNVTDNEAPTDVIVFRETANERSSPIEQNMIKKNISRTETASPLISVNSESGVTIGVPVHSEGACILPSAEENAIRNIGNNFSGFPENDSNRSHRLAIMNDMKDLVSHARRTLAERRRNSRDFRRELLEYRQSISIQADTVDSIVSETSDILTELPVIKTPMRALRSQGPVPLFPNVQQKTLEYKRRKN